MPKIKDINSGSVNLNSYTAPIRELLNKLSEKTNVVLFEMEFEPQTAQQVPKANSISLVLLKPQTKAQTMGIKAYISALQAKNSVINYIEVAEGVWLVGEFGQKEVDFANAFANLKAQYEKPTEIDKPETESTLKEKRTRKTKEEKETENQ